MGSHDVLLMKQIKIKLHKSITKQTTLHLQWGLKNWIR